MNDADGTVESTGKIVGLTWEAYLPWDEDLESASRPSKISKSFGGKNLVGVHSPV